MMRNLSFVATVAMAMSGLMTSRADAHLFRSGGCCQPCGTCSAQPAYMAPIPNFQVCPSYQGMTWSAATPVAGCSSCLSNNSYAPRWYGCGTGCTLAGSYAYGSYSGWGCGLFRRGCGGIGCDGWSLGGWGGPGSTGYTWGGYGGGCNSCCGRVTSYSCGGMYRGCGYRRACRPACCPQPATCNSCAPSCCAPMANCCSAAMPVSAPIVTTPAMNPAAPTPMNNPPQPMPEPAKAPVPADAAVPADAPATGAAAPVPETKP